MSTDSSRAASDGDICWTPACHSQRDVQPVRVLTGDEDESEDVPEPLLCDRCQKYYTRRSS